MSLADGNASMESFFGGRKVVEVTFPKRQPTRYQLVNGQELKIEVTKSASALLIPFAVSTQVHAMSFAAVVSSEWNPSQPERERQREGDDFPLRVGLCHEASSKPWLGFMLPSWVKLVRDSLSLPTDRMTYLVVGSQQVGAWKSPYSDSIEQIPLSSTLKSGEMNSYLFEFKPPIKAVAMWLMSDGDNTNATFTVRMRDLVIQ
jgi:hypothetical protein